MSGLHSSFIGKLLRLALLVLVSALLPACGGGGAESPTSISVSPGSISLTVMPESGVQTTLVTVNYQGTGVVAGFAPGVPVPSWLSVVQSGPASASSAVFAVTADLSSLSPGIHSTSVRFVTGLVPEGGGLEDATNIVYVDLPVRVTVVNLGVSTAEFNLAIPYGATAPSTGSFGLTIDAGSHWTASSDRPWLSVTAASGAGPASLGYSVAPGGLSMGAQSGIIRIADDFGHAVTVTVNVTVSIARLTVSPQSMVINVGSDTSSGALSRTLTVSDELGGAKPAHKATWSVASVDAAWLRMTPASGSTAPAVAATVSVYAPALASMANGTYAGAIKINYTTEDLQSYSVTVPVTLNLNSPLVGIAVTPGSLNNAVGQGAAQQFTATGSYKDGYSQNLTAQVNWTSSSSAVATVSNAAPTAGRAQPLIPGSTTIKAEVAAAGVSGSATLQVVAPSAVAYVLNGTPGTISQYIVNADGSLTAMFKASVPASPYPEAIEFTPDGKYAYVLNEGFASPNQFVLSQFSVDRSGALTPLSPATVALSTYVPHGIAVDSTGKHVYVAIDTSERNRGAVARLNIGSGGALTLDASAPVFVGPVGSSAYKITAHPWESYLYVPDFVLNKVYQFAISAGGAVSALATPSVAAGAYPQQVVVHPSGLYAYAVNFTDNVNPAQPPGYISQYNIGANGALTPMATPKVDAGAMLMSLYMAPSGQSAYLISLPVGGDVNNSSITTYAIDAAGGLSPKFSYSVPFAGALAMDPDEKYLYARNGFQTIMRFAVGSDGSLTPSGEVLNGEDPDVMVVRVPRG